MDSSGTKARGEFGRLGFVMAAVGSAIGLGNIWKFPYIAYDNEGGSFVLVYLAAILLIGAPIMLAEVLIGRRTQQSPVGALAQLSKNVAGGKAWTWIGWLGIASGLVILSFYAMIAGWTVYYFGKCLLWSLQGFTQGDAASLGPDFGAFLANGPMQIAFLALFMGATVGVVAGGVKSGIERTTKTLMPILLGILLLLVIHSTTTPGFGEAVRFLFHIGPIEMDAVLEAVGHAFFTLSLGMGAMITYGSYMGRKTSIPRASGLICLFDTLIALMASLVMFSIIFGVPAAERGATFSKSATILFTTLPRMFYELPLGTVIAPVFYLLISFAALTSTISLLEVVVAYFIDVRGWARRKAAFLVGGGIFLFGVPSALSLGANSFFSNSFPQGGFFGMLDYLSTNWMLPVGGLGIAIFTGWILSPKLTTDELEEGHGRFSLIPVWRFALRFVAPAAILWIIWSVLNGRTFN